MADQIFPEPTVGVFILNKANELLLVKSHKWPGKYVVPGGHVELGETLEQAAVREAKEETGLDIFDLQFINFQQFIHDPAFWKHKHFIFFDFLCRANSLEVKLNDEAQEHIWVKLDAALHLPLDSYTRTSVEKIIEGNMS
jgi:nucleoside triphosphatase